MNEELGFGLHGPNWLNVNGGFSGTLSGFYTGYLGGDPWYENARTVFDKSGTPLSTTLLQGDTAPGQLEPFSISVAGTGYQIVFGETSTGDFLGNAGDLNYDNLQFSNLVGIHDPSAAPEPSTVSLLLLAGSLIFIGALKRYRCPA